MGKRACNTALLRPTFPGEMTPNLDDKTPPRPTWPVHGRDGDELSAARARLVPRAARNLASPLLRRPLGPGIYEVVEIAGPSPGDITRGPAERLVERAGGPARLFRIARRNTLALPYEVVAHRVGPKAGFLRIRTFGETCPAAVALALAEFAERKIPGGFLFTVPAVGVAGLVPLGRICRPLPAAGGTLPRFSLGTRYSALACAHALATFAVRAHTVLPAPFAPTVFWVRGRRLLPVPVEAHGRSAHVLPGDDLAAVLSAAPAAHAHRC